MSNSIHLRTFSKDQLILSEEETKSVLTFFFPEHEKRINIVVITDSARGFAQGLLVEAIDATYAMGYIEALFKALLAGGMMPTEKANAAVRIMKEFVKEASSHWFKHATVHDLVSVKIYETVRLAINRNFDIELNRILGGLARNAPPTAYVDYASVFYKSRYYWG